MLWCRYDVISCTLWLEVAASTGDTMPLITGGSSMGMQENWATTLYFLSCRTNSQGFYMNFILFDFESLDLPYLPADRSNFDVHGALDDEQVRVQRRILVNCHLYYIILITSLIHIKSIIAIDQVKSYYTV